MKIQFVLLLVATAAISSCKKENPNEMVHSLQKAEVLILNNGDGTSGSASVSAITHSGDLVLDQFQETNGNRMPYACSDIVVVGERAYALSTALGKLIIMDARTCQWIGAVDGLNQAKSLHVLDAATAFVTAGGNSGLVYKVDLTNQAIVGLTAVGPFPGEMTHVDDRLFINCRGLFLGTQQSIDVVDMNTMSLLQSTSLDRIARGWVKDSQGMLWQLRQGYAMVTDACDGTMPYPAKLVRIDPSTFETVTYDIFDTDDLYPSELTITSDGNMLYFLNNGLHRVDLTTTISAQIVLSEPCSAYAIDPSNGHIWITQTGKHQGANKILHHNADGQYIEGFSAGVEPIDIVFVP